MRCPTCAAGDTSDLPSLSLTKDEVLHVLHEHNGEEVGPEWMRKLCRDYLILREYAEDAIRDEHA